MDARAQRRIAFFGGTFDPPHRGHLAVARAAADCFRLDRILFAPVARQPLKLESQPTSMLHRYAMVALATADDPRFVASQLDVADTGAPNFTVDAIARLRNEEPDAKLFSLIGADAFQSIARWREPQKLLSLCDWIVAARPGYSLDALEAALPAGVVCATLEDDEEDEGLLLRHEHQNSTRVLLLKETREDVSATEVRSAITEDAWKMQDVPPRVADYIRKTRLYQESF